MAIRYRLKYLAEQIGEGYAAYQSGIKTVEKAKAANPYKGFGERAEHVRFISWNRGWNHAMQDDHCDDE